jgi:transposase
MAWRPRKLTAEQREERRMEAVRLLRSGWSQERIARELGVSPAAVCKWAGVLKAQGERGLVARPRPGRRSRLSPEQWQQLGDVLQAGALAWGFDTERWTLRRIAEVIWERFGVSYNPNYLAEPLRKLGFSPQQPPTQAHERNEELVRAWLKRDWPRIKRGLAEREVSLPSWTRQVTRFGPA